MAKRSLAPSEGHTAGRRVIAGPSMVCLALAGLLGASALALAAAPASGYIVIPPTGSPRLHFGPDLSCQIVADGSGGYVDPPLVLGDCGFVIELGGVVYGPDFASHASSRFLPVAGGLPYVPFTPVFQYLNQSGPAWFQATRVALGTTGYFAQAENSGATGMGWIALWSPANVPGRIAFVADCSRGIGAPARSYGSMAGAEVACTNAPNDFARSTLKLRAYGLGMTYAQGPPADLWSQTTGAGLQPACSCTKLADAGVAWQSALRGGQGIEYRIEVADAQPIDTGAMTLAALAECAGWNTFTATGAPTDAQWEWTIGSRSSPDASPALQLAAGTYEVSAWAYNATRAFTGTASVQVAPPTPCCPGNPTTVTAIGEVGKTLRVTVELPDGWTSTQFSGPLGSAFSAANATFWWTPGPTQAGRHQASVIAQGGACSATVRLLVYVTPTGERTEAPDQDRDGIADWADNCVHAPNHDAADDQRDRDRDGVGDACDATPCGISEGPAQAVDRTCRAGSAGQGDDAFGVDRDQDGVSDLADGCPDRADPAQEDQDGDGFGDACDADVDGDGMPNWGSDPMSLLDNCPFVANPSQEDDDADGRGEACDEAAVLPRQADGGSPAGPTADRAPAGLPVLAALLGATLLARWRSTARRR